MARLSTSLKINSGLYGGKSSSFQSNNIATSLFDTTFKVNNSDTFKQLIDFKSDGTKTYNKFNFMVLSNAGNQPAEIQIVLREFNTGTDLADANPESATLDFILTPGKYFILPTSKMMIYSTDPDDNDVYAAGDTSAGNKDGTSVYDTAYSVNGPTFIDPPGYFSASGADGTVAIVASTTDTVEVDVSEDFFKNLQFGNGTTGYSNAKICLFGEVHANDVGTVRAISAIGSGTAYNNSKITLADTGGAIADDDATQIGGYRPVAQLNEALDASETEITWDNFGSDATAINLFKRFDIIRIGNELMQVIANNSVTSIEVKRGVLGTTAAAHDDDDGIGFHYMNNALADVKGVAGIVPLKGNSNIYTSGNGSFSANTFFGLGRGVALPNGLVPGSVAIKFFSPATLPLGLSRLSATSTTGLSANTAYEFKITVDGGTQTTITFTTDASVTSLGNTDTGVGVLRKIQSALDTASMDVRIAVRGGDIVFSGKTRYNGKSSIVLAAGSTGTAELFGTGIFPSIADIRPSSTPLASADDDENNIMFDNGLGQLVRKNGGSGIINYETGAFRLVGCPPNSHMKIACNVNSALSGLIKSSRANVVPAIKARSLNAFRDAYIKVMAFDDAVDDDNVELLMPSTESDGKRMSQGNNPNESIS